MRRYVSQLLQIAEGNKKLSDYLTRKIKEAKYEKDDLLKIFVLLNNTSAGSEIKPKQKKFRSSTFYVGVRLNKENIKYLGDHALAEKKTNNTPSYLPAVSLGVDLPHKPSVGRLIYRAELSIGVSNPAITANPHKYLSIKHQPFYATATLTPQFYYNLYNARLVKWYIGAGVNLDFRIPFKNEYEITYKPDMNTTQPGPKIQQAWISIPVKTGILLINKIEIVAIYFPDAALTQATNYNAFISNLSLGLNYKLKKAK